MYNSKNSMVNKDNCNHKGRDLTDAQVSEITHEVDKKVGDDMQQKMNDYHKERRG